MRSLMIAAAALVAVAAPGVAAAQTGYVGAVYANTDIDGIGDGDVYGIEGAVAFQGSGSIGFQFDAALLDSDNADATAALAAHIFSRNDRYLFGGFAALATNDDSTTYEVGVEANKYLNRVTIAGALSYANNDDFDVDGYGVNVQARFFPQDNLRLQASLGWANVDAGFADEDGFTYGVAAEWQPHAIALPISFGAGYQRTDFGPLEADTLSVSVRYNWGGTLYDRDRNGASQAGLSFLSGLLGY